MPKLRSPSSPQISTHMNNQTQKTQITHLSELKAISALDNIMSVQQLSEKDQESWYGIEKQRRGRTQEYQWSLQEEKLLYRLHDSCGNKWAVISEHFKGRNDNHLKNHFFSRLRMAIRHLNKHAVKIMGKKARVVKDQVLYKIISICDQFFNKESKQPKQLINFSRNLKNQILNYLYNSKNVQSAQVEKLITNMHSFSNLFKNRKNEEKTVNNEQEKLKQQSSNICQRTNINHFWFENEQIQRSIHDECLDLMPIQIQDSFLSLKSCLPIEIQVKSMKHSLFSKQPSIETNVESIHSPSMTASTPLQNELMLIQKPPIILASNPFLSIEPRFILQYSYCEQEYFAQPKSEEQCQFGNYFIFQQIKSHQRLNSF